MLNIVDSKSPAITLCAVQNIRNTLLLEKVMKYTRKHLQQQEMLAHKQLELQSQEEAVQLTLKLASQPIPPMPEFVLEKRYVELLTPNSLFLFFRCW